MNTCPNRNPSIFLFTSKTKTVVSVQQWDRAAASLSATSSTPGTEPALVLLRPDAVPSEPRELWSCSDVCLTWDCSEIRTLPHFQ